MAGPRSAPAGERVKVRRDINLTVVISVGLACLTAATLAYLAVCFELASQGLDVRPLMPRVRLGPEQWGWLAVVAGGMTGGGFLVKRSNRTEALVGRQVPQRVEAALAAQRADIIDGLGSLFAQALHEHRERVALQQPEADVDGEEMLERMTQLLEQAAPPRRLVDTGQWEALVHGQQPQQ